MTGEGRSPARTRTRRLHRARILLDRRVTPATVLDVMCSSHPDSAMLDAGSTLPYPMFEHRRLAPREALSFAARTGQLLREAGMRRHDRVAIFKTNAVDHVLLALAVIRAGGIAVPVNPGMPLDALANHLRHVGSRILVCDRAAFRATIGEQERLPTVERWVFTDDPGEDADACVVLAHSLADADDGAAPVSLARDDHVILAHTSGTTGTPKAVVGTAGSVLEGIRVHYLTEPPLPRTRALIAGPFSHLVYQIGLTTAMLSNVETWAVAAPAPEQVLALIDRARINVVVAFPELYLRMYAAGLDDHSLASMRAWIGVADTSHEAHMRAFCQRGALLRCFGRPLVRSVFVEPLGSSEIGGPAIRRVWHAHSRMRFRRRIGRRMWGGPEVRVADADGRGVPDGQVGRLMVKGRTTFAGYWNGDEQPHGKLADGWWATGDVAYRDRWRRFHHLDRESDVVWTATGPFYTLPAEDVLHAFPGVQDAVVFGVPSDGRGEVPVAVVWLRPDVVFDEPAILRWAAAKLTTLQRLHAVRAIAPDDIPRGLTGKVLKRELRERFASLATRDG